MSGFRNVNSNYIVSSYLQSVMGNCKVLNAYLASAANTQSFYYRGAAYVVPTGKKAIIRAIIARTGTAQAVQLVSTTAAAENTAAPTGRTALKVTGTASSRGILSLSTSLANESILEVEVAAGLYICMEQGNAAEQIVTLIITEESA